MITILSETTKNPISLIGERAGVCWGSDTSDPKRNYNRGLNCIRQEHGRTWEFVNIELIIEGYSARVIREYYTHIGGSPTRLQTSTRYVDYENFEYFIPDSIKNNPQAKTIYNEIMRDIQIGIKTLKDEGIQGEDIANVLPLGMHTKIIDKRNLRSLVDMSHQRMCSRAYEEYRKLFKEITDTLAAYSPEWEEVVNRLFRPKCEYRNKCVEKNPCRPEYKTGEST